MAFRPIRKIKEAIRIRKILFLFAKHGFGWVTERVSKLGKIRANEKGINHSLVGQADAERVRMLLEELGPTFIKFGQILSTKIDIIPETFIKELSKLQDQTIPLPFETIKDVVEQETGAPLFSTFSFFEKSPVASASIAQVHRACIGSDEIVVKIQRPKIKKVIDTDMALLEDLASLAEKVIPEATKFQPKMVVDEFKKVLAREMDFTYEGLNIEKFRQNFENDNNVQFPKVYWKLTTPKLLCMERIDGIKISDLDGIEKLGLSKEEIAKKGVDFLLRQIFEHGFFHGDPHPGNIFITKDGKIAPIDFGIVGVLDPAIIDKVFNSLPAFFSKDVSKIAELLVDIGILEPSKNTPEFRRSLLELLQKFFGLPLEQLGISAMTKEGIALFRNYDIKIPRDFVLLGKALGEVEGIGKLLYPEFNVVEYIKSYVLKLKRKSFKLDRLIQTGREYMELLMELPKDVLEFLKKMREGKLQIEGHDKGFEDVVGVLNRGIRKIIITIVMLFVIFVIFIIFIIWCG